MTASPARSIVVALLLTAVPIGLVGCSETEDPLDANRRRLTERLGETFSGDRVSCIVGSLDDETIEVLLDDGDLGGADELDSYSDAVRDCLSDEDATGPR